MARGCKDGYAEGLGALRNAIGRTGGTPDELFLGRLDRGNLRSGVLVTAQGYTAGRWQEGSLTGTGTDDQAGRNTLLAAFEDGANAAEALSKTQAGRSNPKAARFYIRLAKRLHSQMEGNIH